MNTRYYNAGERFCRMVRAGSTFAECVNAMKSLNVSMPMEKLSQMYLERSVRRNAADEVKGYLNG